jgi:outer membrane protein
MIRFQGILFMFLTIIPAIRAQQVWTLEDCIGYAMENNITLKRQELHSDIARNNHNQARLNILPGLSGFANHEYLSGRALNIENHQWENRDFQHGNLGMQGHLNIFSGFQNTNNIRQQEFLLMSRLEEVEMARNNLSMNIAAAYFQILLDMELLELARNQVEISKLEIDAAKANFNLGNISMGRLLEIESQNAANEYQVTLAVNNLSNSYLNLIQILQLDPGEDFRIVRPEDFEISEAALLQPVSGIYDQAEMLMPQVRSAEYFLKSRERQLALVRGQQSPSLYLRGLMYSRYQEIASDPVTGGNYPYPAQIRDNRYWQMGISLQVPIFNGWTVRNRISNARVGVSDARYQVEEARMNLYTEIHLMYNNANNAFTRYNSADKAVSFALQSSDHSREQFRLGLINFVEYQNSQSGLFRAESNRAQAKYEYYLRSMILDFYVGQPLGLD